ncbi:hypothetical protein NIES4072_65300 [Nostoc commune NIES-4072]|uniref:Uncharacterized protein n=1 Tax=Nostoc commune NIES-4072 TaxID=2005467 RepID=A0A2R5FZC2_NOSCO|nr:hypothetical protein [Nostoc commune]BBD70164.1 hypothetical protein NIES4070_65750 [Nostoc commune HK-02]GBG22818.1 hypothetical protein NIES4072_65300 [Nostoc commune NIES-4072]
MTYPIYSQQALSRYTLPRLKRIAADLGANPTEDKRAAETWVNAIITHQSTQLQKVTDEQAQAIAPKPLTIVEISFDHHEYYAGSQLIASITHDDSHLTQRWVVMVNDKEVFRANTLMRCDRFICTHYKDGSLPVQEKETTPPTTENRIMAHIFNECQNYGFEILNDGIYTRNTQDGKLRKLGEVGCTDGNWWVKEGCSDQQQYSNSVYDAVRSLSMVDVSCDSKSIFDEYFLEQPLEQLTGDKLQRLLERTELVIA